MNELLNNPFFQSAVAPFVVSLVVALIMRPHGWVWGGLSALAGFAVTAYLLTGFQLFPLRSDRKILLMAGVAIIVSLILQLLPWRRMVAALVVIGAAGGALWLVWPRFRFLEGIELWGIAVGGTIYLVWLSFFACRLRDQTFRADSMLLALGTGTGISALLGATALYGQLGGAVAAAAGARILLHLLARPVSGGLWMVVPLTLVCGLLGLGAVVYAKLPWYSLAVLALVPVLASVPLPGTMPRWVSQGLTLLLVLIPALAAIGLVWQKAGAPPI